MSEQETVAVTVEGEPIAAPAEVETEKCEPIKLNFAIGEVVRYVRVNAENQTEKGTGKVLAALLDHTGRVVYRIKDGEKMFNADAISLNADQVVEDKYVAHHLEVRKLADEANAAIKKMTDEANAEIDRLHTAVLGAPLAV